MPRIPFPLRLIALLLGGLAPALVFGVRMDADWYWREDLNGLLHVRVALHGAAFLYAAATCAWLLLPRRGASRLDAFVERAFPTGLLLGLVTTPIPAVVGGVSLLEALLRGGLFWEALILLHPLGYALICALWIRTPTRRIAVGVTALAGALAPLALLTLFQLVVWRAERRCFVAVQADSEAYLSVVEEQRPLAWAMNLDPLLTTYLREAGYLVPRPLPAAIPVPGQRGYRIARAWRMLTGEEIGAAALERFRVLSRSNDP